ncbi:hypothetical protein CYLTODRAFT_460179 [Cylindrobasidium torrendii FP15055 ss-10]|uniref:Uncharacterized protein n=1 Tax=Cylindrobasidium torrendii FP15055 ss-10 TaxID=1314674 RepID=A0A0D7ASQ6_9AGAR|nr:hypothetical protein CYLTODRAFT_460179 [Cylindrobasidium torrendii FP15055 ss-10]
MSAIYTENCISLSSFCPNTMSEQLVKSNDLLDFRTHEGAAGMDIGEMLEKMDQPINLPHLASERVARAFALAVLAFWRVRPTPSHFMISTSIMPIVLYLRSERRRFDEMAELQQTCEYAPPILPEFQRDVFLKHPVTGAVTIHQHPYGDMPRFRLLTAHPSLVPWLQDNVAIFHI